MAFKIKFGDVGEFQGDAILNSLGVQGAIYGRLCKNIIEQADDKELKKFVDEIVDGIYGQIFLTNAGKLPCKKIIHIITPVKEIDPHNELLKKAYRDAVDLAIEKGYKTLGLPFIGTGANGYTESDAFDAVTEVCEEISELEHKKNCRIIDITVIAYLKKRHISEEYFSIEYEKKKKENGLDKNLSGNPIAEVMNFYKNIDFGNFLKLKMEYLKRPFDFVTEYMNKKNISGKRLSSAFLDRRRKSQMNKQKSLSKIDVYRLAFILEMNVTETVEFMTVCGLCFSPLDKRDMFYLNYIQGKYGKVKSLYKLDELAYSIFGSYDCFGDGKYFIYGTT